MTGRFTAEANGQPSGALRGFAIPSTRVVGDDFASPLRSNRRDGPLDSCEPFPFPETIDIDATPGAVGAVYHDHRAALMIARNEGLTKTYNRFHDPAERAPFRDEVLARLLDLNRARAEEERRLGLGTHIPATLAEELEET